MTLSLLLLASSFIFLFLFAKLRPHLKPASGSGLLDLMKNHHRIVDWLTDLLKSSPTHTVATPIGIVTADPKIVEHVFKTRFDNYPKGEHFLYALHDFLGSGIFNSDGEVWKSQRKTASLEFKTKTIRSFIMSNLRVDVADRLLPLLSSASAKNKQFDLQEVLFRFAFDNVCKVVFSWDPARLGEDCVEGKEFNEAFEEACTLTMLRFRHAHPILWRLKRLLRLGSEGKLRRRIDYVQKFAMRVVKSRRVQSPATHIGDDLLSRFMAADENSYSDEYLRDVVLSFVLAGRDTTSATLTWFFWLVAKRPDVKERIEAEIANVRARCSTKSNFFTLDEVRDMDYLHAALSETLRLYPAVPLEGRTCSSDDVLPNGVGAKKGQWVMYNSYAMGRMAEIWGEDWARFRPERWLGGGEFQQRSPFEYPVFNAGPRTCLGKEMAYIQMKVVAASVMERFELDLVEEEEEKLPELTIIMKMKGGLQVRVTEKKVAGVPLP